LKSLSAQSLIVSFISLMVFWYIMSGFFDITHSLMGVLSVGIVMAINYKLKAHSFFEGETDVIKDLRFFYAPYYFAWLLMQIVISGIQVAKILLSPSLPIQTSVVKFKVDFPNPHCKMILGNSITLTPGTLTVDIQGDEFIVHAISPFSFEGIASDAMPQQVLKLFTKEMHPVVSDFEVIHTQEGLI
jgi:multicomponent Na+:H+ antiporter subunit E